MKAIPITALAFIILFSLSCQSSSRENKANDSEDISITGITGDSIKMVKSAGMRFKVKNTSQAIREIGRLARSFNGIVMKQDLDNSQLETKELNISEDSLMVISTYNPTAEIIARIPSADLDDFLFSVRELSDFTNNSRLDIQDKSIEYLASQLKQNARAGTMSNDTGKKATGLTALQKLSFRDQSNEEELNKRKIDADVNYSTVELRLEQNPILRKEIMANTSLTHYQLPFSRRLYDALGQGTAIFLDLLVALANLWIFLLAGLLAWIMIKYYRVHKRVVFSKNRQA